MNSAPKITKACQRAVEKMAEAEAADELEDAEIVCDGGVCYIGYDRISKATVHQLLRLCVIRDESDGKGVERYTLNEDGRALAKNPAHPLPILAELSKARP